MVDFYDSKQGFSVKNLFPEQCRAARGLLNWTQEKLAVLAGVSRSTVRDFENGRHQLHRATAAVLVDTLEKAGIRLLSDQHEVGIKRSEEHTYELQSLMRISVDVFGL